MSEAVDRLIERLLNIFGPPNCDNPADYIDELRGALKGYDWQTCMQMGDAARDRCKFFPRPAELREFADEIVRENAWKNRKPYEPEPEIPPPSPEQAARVKALVDEAKQAIAENTIFDRKHETNWIAGQRPGFEKMQRESPNTHLHRVRTLTPASKRMMGENDE